MNILEHKVKGDSDYDSANEDLASSLKHKQTSTQKASTQASNNKFENLTTVQGQI